MTNILSNLNPQRTPRKKHQKDRLLFSIIIEIDNRLNFTQIQGLTNFCQGHPNIPPSPLAVSALRHESRHAFL